MKINCLSCGHRLELDDDAYSDYEGQAKCYTCSQLLEIKTTEGKLSTVRLARTREAPLDTKAARPEGRGRLKG
ncbi:MAG: hypothetical protein WAW37_11580 [Syntrophobacteraceae bacterium]